MIKLIRKDTGIAIYINPDFIVTIEDSESNGTLLQLQAGGSCIVYRVIQNSKEILNLISTSKV